MKIAMRVTVDIDPQEWESVYGVDRDGLREDVKDYVKNAIESMPIAPAAVTVK